MGKYKFQYGGDQQSQYADTSFLDMLAQYAQQPQDEQEVTDTAQEETKEPQDNSDYEDLRAKYDELAAQIEQINTGVKAPYTGDDEFMNFIFSDSDPNAPLDTSLLEVPTKSIATAPASAPAAPTSTGTYTSKSGTFQSFATPEAGRAALEHQLELYKSGKSNNTTGNETLAQAMGIYAPSSDGNDPQHYANFVAKSVGVSPDTPIKQIDTKKWADAITKMEGNKRGNNPGNLRPFQNGGTIDNSGVKQYYSDWMSSPMYKKMMSDPDIQKKRDAQLANFPEMQLIDQSAFKDANPLMGVPMGRYDKATNVIQVNNQAPKGLYQTIGIHEGGHQVYNALDNIPQSNIELMNSLIRPGMPQTEPFKTISNPVEIPSMLNQLREEGIRNKIYDPMNEPFDKKYIQKYRNSPAMRTLKQVYDDDALTQLMNSVSKTDQAQLPIAQNGGKFNPITVSNPNDSRLKAYQDSLSLYNSTDRFRSAINKYGKLKQPYSINEFERAEEANYSTSSNQAIKSTPYGNTYGVGANPTSGYYVNEFKKPIQPVVYQKSETISPQQPAQRSNKYMDKNQLINEYNKESWDYYVSKDRTGKQIIGVNMGVNGDWGTPVYAKSQPQLKRMPYSPITNQVDPAQSSLNVGSLKGVPQEDNTYRVEYEDENGKMIHKDFPNEKMGTQFQQVLSGNRRGYYLQNGGDVSSQGYNDNSPYKNSPYLYINTPSGNITMENSSKYLLGIDEYGNKKVMKPGKKYKFAGKTVKEIPLNI